MKNKPIELEQEIKDSMNKIDQIEVSVPELNFFTDLINQQEGIAHRKQNLQFALFIGCAIVLMSLLFVSLFTYTIIFFIIQGLTTLAPILWLTFYLYHKKERVR